MVADDTHMAATPEKTKQAMTRRFLSVLELGAIAYVCKALAFSRSSVSLYIGDICAMCYRTGSIWALSGFRFTQKQVSSDNAAIISPASGSKYKL